MITVVSGLPRSGTSMMMRMLQLGGMELLIDTKRPADESNQYGYFEYEPIKRLAQDSLWLDQAEGKALKIIAQLLAYLPTGHDYKVIFMERPIETVLTSQTIMLKKKGLDGTSLSREQLETVFLSQVAQAKAFLQKSQNITFLAVSYPKTIAHPEKIATSLKSFLNVSLDVKKMVEAVDPLLCRSSAYFNNHLNLDSSS